MVKEDEAERADACPGSMLGRRHIRWVAMSGSAQGQSTGGQEVDEVVPKVMFYQWGHVSVTAPPHPSNTIVFGLLSGFLKISWVG